MHKFNNKIGQISMSRIFNIENTNEKLKIKRTNSSRKIDFDP